MSKQNACVIRMHAVTNDVPYINLMTLLVNGKKFIALDRDRTEYDFDRETGRLDMTWLGLYIWDGEEPNYDVSEELFDNAEIVGIEIEDDAPEDYEFRLEGATVNGKAIPIKIGMAKAEAGRNASLMEDIVRYCVLTNTFEGFRLYTNGHKYSSERVDGANKIVIPVRDEDLERVKDLYSDMSDLPKEVAYYDCGEADVDTHGMYANESTLFMTFGYDFVHYYAGESRTVRTEDDIEAIAKEHGLCPYQDGINGLTFEEIW